MQTAANCCEALGIPPEKWTVTCVVGEVRPNAHDVQRYFSMAPCKAGHNVQGLIACCRALTAFSVCCAVFESWHSGQEARQDS